MFINMKWLKLSITSEFSLWNLEIQYIIELHFETDITIGFYAPKSIVTAICKLAFCIIFNIWRVWRVACTRLEVAESFLHASASNYNTIHFTLGHPHYLCPPIFLLLPPLFSDGRPISKSSLHASASSTSSMRQKHQFDPNDVTNSLRFEIIVALMHTKPPILNCNCKHRAFFFNFCPPIL